MRGAVKTISRKQKFRQKIRFVLFIFSAAFFLISFFLVFFTNLFNIKSVDIIINDEISVFPVESKIELENLLLEKNILFFSKDKINNYFKDKYQNVQSITFNRTLGRSVTVKVNLYEVRYVGCVLREAFLIPCMYADTNGLFFKEIDLDPQSENIQNDVKEKVKNKNLYYIEVSPESLSLINAKNKINNSDIDSISGTRLYNQEEMYILMQFIKWIEKMSYIVDKIEAKNLKIVNITTNSVTFKLALNKGFAQTVKDFENLSNQDFFKKLDKGKLKYVDLSYKDKIFYKEFTETIITKDIKSDLEIGSTTSTTSDIVN